MAPLLEVENLSVRYGDLIALRDASLTVSEGEVVCIIGPNGAGKSTALAAIAGGVTPVSGAIRLDGKSILGQRPEQIARLRLSLVPEGRHIFGTLTVAENLQIGGYMLGDRAAARSEMERLLGHFPRLRERLRYPAGRLSGGEQQMLAVARAVMTRPRLLLVDEPSLGLAPKIIDQIYEILLELRQREKMTLLINEQSSARILKFADRVYVLRKRNSSVGRPSSRSPRRRGHPPRLFWLRQWRPLAGGDGRMIEFLQNLIDSLALGSIYALTALGIGLLFGILRLINFAHGDMITIGAYALIVPSADVTARLLIGSWTPAAVVIAISMIVVVAALITDAAVFRPLRTASSPTLMISSFAVSYIIQNGILIFYGARPKAVDFWSGANVQVYIGELRVPLLQLITLVVTLVLMVALTLFLRRTPYGVQMRAAAEDFRMAQYLGVRGNIVVGLAFAISGIFAATVSMLYITQSGSLTNQMGVPLALFAFVAVVVGGMGNLTGAVVGGFVLGLIVTMLQAYLPSDLRAFRDAFAFGVVILVLLIRPAGLLPASTTIERV